MRTVPLQMAAIVAAAFAVGAPIPPPLETGPGAMLLGLCSQPADTVGPPPTPSKDAEGARPPSDGAGTAPQPPQDGNAESGDEPDVSTEPLQPADQREARVLMTSGTTLTGLLASHTKEMVILKINGIETPIPVKDIARIDTLLPNRERYEQFRQALGPSDVRGRINLVRWLQSVDMLTEAVVIVEETLKLEPENPQAKDLKVQLDEQKRLRETGGRQPKEHGAKPQEAGKTKLPPFPTLTADQVNQIRVYEVNLSDPPRMSVSRDTITKLLEQYAGDPLIPVNKEGRDAVYRKRPEQILELMFKLRARDLYSQVRVQGDPESLRKFRESVHRGWLANYCATNDCHGGTDAGRLWLNSRLPNSDATVYTNFLILDRTRVRAAKGDHKGDLVPMIDYANPEQSPLLQLALPPEESLFPHPTPNRPGKQPYRPLFRNSEDARFQRAMEWIRSMYVPRPDYQINYSPPTPPQAPVARQDGGDPTSPPEAPKDPR